MKIENRVASRAESFWSKGAGFTYEDDGAHRFFRFRPGRGDGLVGPCGFGKNNVVEADRPENGSG